MSGPVSGSTTFDSQLTTALAAAYLFDLDPAATPDIVAAEHARLLRHADVAAVRAPGESLVVVDVPEAGLASLWLVADDMPGLVESVIAAVEAEGHSVTRVEHPVVAVERDDAGTLVGAPGPVTESWICLAVAGSVDADALTARLRATLRSVASVGGDRLTLQAGFAAEAGDLGAFAPLDAPGRDESVALLRWLSEGHFRLFGYVEAGLADDGGVTVSDEARLGVYREIGPRGTVSALASAETLVSITRVYEPTGLQSSRFPNLVTIARFRNGRYAGEHRFLGRLTVAALNANLADIPLLRGRVREVLAAAQVNGNSYTGMVLQELLQVYPRSELFNVAPSALARDLLDVMAAIPAREVRLITRPAAEAHLVSAIVFLPRDRYTTKLREESQSIVIDAVSGTEFEYTAKLSDSPMAQLNILIRVPGDTPTDISAGSTLHDAVQQRLADAVRSWDDELWEHGLDRLSTSEIAHYLPLLPEGYKAERTPEQAADDVETLRDIAPDDFSVRVVAADGAWRLVLTLAGRTATISQILPVLHSLGVTVIDEQPYSLTRPDGVECALYDFGLGGAAEVTMPGDTRDAERRFTEAFAAIWRGEAEESPFNELVLRCGLDWRQASMLYAYGQYLRQLGFAYSSAHLAATLKSLPEITAGIVRAFEVSFDPAAADEAAREEALAELDRQIGDIMSLDADRVVRGFLDVLRATVRTNFYAVDENGCRPPALAFKLHPREIPQAPKPRPAYEIFVYSPEVEGVHLRYGDVARGGLRWSDRREDFRTEILGLVKAQAVKNAVIVPVGAKGGFVVKRPTPPTGDDAVDRDAFRAKGIECYRIFIGSLLDVTDDIDGTGAVVPPRGVVRRDGDDTYLVVAADKGTATFSDIANGVAVGRGFWLGDGFASGGSAGYDHKAMGITARGAWESVKRHFREFGVDTQAEDFRVVGIGDMSGDVFGNGMLCSPHIRLVAAFDHRSIFIDPNPDAAASWAERKRIFDLPRSSWDDYDRGLISAGGGVWSRSLKSVPIGPEIRAALGLDDDVTAMSPPELMRAILLAPVDLLWNGGIGTYIKASTQTNEQVGDKANDAIRVDGGEIRARVVGEGGNLGVTELGRIEFALGGGRINTDALDNSAGVDCSDHEVNIKILLDSQVKAGSLAPDERNPLLESMTDEVSDLVLADNISQNAELGLARARAGELYRVHQRQLQELADRGVDLKLEALPTPAQLAGRDKPLSSPELATLLAHIKLTLKEDLLATDLPDNDVFTSLVVDYFPTPLRERFADGIVSHPLRRQIVAMRLVNDLVDHAGMSHVFHLCEGSGTTTADVVRAYVAVREIFDLPSLWARIDATRAPITALNDMVSYVRRLLFRASQWLLTNRPQPLAVAAEISRYRARVTQYGERVPEWTRGATVAAVEGRTAAYTAQGVEEELARWVALTLERFCLLDIIDVSDIADRDCDEVGRLYFALMARLDVEQLLVAVSDLQRSDRWPALARLALRDDLYGAVRDLALTILDTSVPGEPADVMIADWEQRNAARVARVRATLDEIIASGELDLATLSVGTRQIRSIVR